MTQRGFTFIELVILLAVLGIITAIVLPMFKNDILGPNPNYQAPKPPPSSVRCEGGFLLKYGEPVIADGKAVKC